MFSKSKMNPVQKLWASLKVKWRLTHPIEGILKPLIKEFWRQTKDAAKQILWLVVHVAHAVRSTIRVALSWPGLLVLWGTGLWAWAAGIYSGMGFLKRLLIVYALLLLKELSQFIAQKVQNFRYEGVNARGEHVYG